MRKRFLAALMCVCLGMTMFACGASKDDNTKETESGTSEATEPAYTEEDLVDDSNGDLNILDYVDLGDYKGIELTKSITKVTDDEVTNEMESKAVELTGSDVTVEDGDTAIIDFVVKLNGVAFDGGTASNYELEIGSGSFIDGFEDGLVGAVKGDQKDLNLTFPDPYPNNPDLAGKAVVFEVTVNAVKERSVPELTDEFVASVSPDDGTVEKYRESTRENLLEQKQLSIDNQRDTDILNAVVDNSEVVCSTASIDEAYDTQLKAYTNMLSSYGVDLATYAGMIGSDEDSFKQKIREEAKEMAKQSLVLNEIAKQENITIDDSDKEALAKRYGYESLETMLQNDNIDQKMVDDTALMQKTLDFLVENAKITVSTEENNAALNTEAAEDEAE